ncbi:hypothetical protein V6Z12_D01G135800 [Gossypium hirsutum]
MFSSFFSFRGTYIQSSFFMQSVGSRKSRKCKCSIATNSGDVNLGGPQRAMHVDPSSIYGQGIMQSKPGIGNTDLMNWRQH